VPGIAASTGSLGHGLSMAVGMAYAELLSLKELEKLGPPYTHDDTGVPRVFCLLSDGECQEGSTWEAVMMAANLKLDNLTVFVDNNDFGGLERLTEHAPALYPLGQKFGAFGWWWSTVTDGHDENALSRAVQRQRAQAPLVVVAHTIKGKGVSYMENNPIWHYRSPNADEYQQAMKELE
jgi:transketolase